MSVDHIKLVMLGSFYEARTWPSWKLNASTLLQYLKCKILCKIDRVWLLNISTTTDKKRSTRKSRISLVYIFQGRHCRSWHEPVQVVAHSGPVESQHLQTTPSVGKILEYFGWGRDESALASMVLCFWDADTVTISSSRSKNGLGIPMFDPFVFRQLNMDLHIHTHTRAWIMELRSSAVFSDLQK